MLSSLRSLAACVIVVFLANASSVSAQLVWNGGFANNGLIPDGDPVGWSDTRSVAGFVGNITSISVSLEISGGWNGDYYAYLSHGDGFAVLLNRVGRTAAVGGEAGYSDAGLHVTFDDHAANGDVHQYQSVSGYTTLISSGGSFVPDGRYQSPLTVVNTDVPSRRLDQFTGLSPNGLWTLFVADVSGGEQGTVQSWSLSIQAVPELGMTPIVAGVGLGAFAVWRRLRRE